MWPRSYTDSAGHLYPDPLPHVSGKSGPKPKKEGDFMSSVSLTYAQLKDLKFGGSKTRMALAVFYVRENDAQSVADMAECEREDRRSRGYSQSAENLGVQDLAELWVFKMLRDDPDYFRRQREEVDRMINKIEAETGRCFYDSGNTCDYSCSLPKELDCNE